MKKKILQTYILDKLLFFITFAVRIILIFVLKDVKFQDITI